MSPFYCTKDGGSLVDLIPPYSNGLQDQFEVKVGSELISAVDFSLLDKGFSQVYPDAVVIQKTNQTFMVVVGSEFKPKSASISLEDTTVVLNNVALRKDKSTEITFTVAQSKNLNKADFSEPCLNGEVVLTDEMLRKVRIRLVNWL